MLSEALKADYISLVNSEIDGIQIDTAEDFALVCELLRGIVNPGKDNLFNHANADKFRSNIEDIQDLLSSPEEYVREEDDYEEYKDVICRRISQVIEKFESYTPDEQASHIREQRQRIAHVDESQRRLLQGISEREQSATNYAVVRHGAPQDVFRAQREDPRQYGAPTTEGLLLQYGALMRDRVQYEMVSSEASVLEKPWSQAGSSWMCVDMKEELMSAVSEHSQEIIFSGIKILLENMREQYSFSFNNKFNMVAELKGLITALPYEFANCRVEAMRILNKGDAGFIVGDQDERAMELISATLIIAKQRKNDDLSVRSLFLMAAGRIDAQLIMRKLSNIFYVNKIETPLQDVQSVHRPSYRP